MTPIKTSDGAKIELLANGYVRVDCPSGLVRMWERIACPFGERDCHQPSHMALGSKPQIRSGQGSPSQDEYRVVRDLLGCR